MWFSGDPKTQEAYGASTNPLQDAVNKIQRANGQSEQQRSSNGGHKQ